MASLAAFNRWLEDDWGYNSRDRLIALPMLSLADPGGALLELDRLIEQGARIVHIRPAPVPGPNGTSRSLGDRRHDPVWSRLAEASIPVAFHLGTPATTASPRHGGPPFEGFGKTDVLSRILVSDRAIHDTVASLIVDGVFTRHPALRVASVDGSDWLHVLVKRLRKQANQTPLVFPEDPLEVVRQHVWVTPYCEENLRALADFDGVERILLARTGPTARDSPSRQLTKELSAFDEEEVRRIMRENCLDLLGATP